jgi:hypothetical protein
VKTFPIFRWDHFNSVPWATIEKGAIRPFAYALLATDAQIGIDFDASEW